MLIPTCYMNGHKNTRLLAVTRYSCKHTTKRLPTVSILYLARSRDVQATAFRRRGETAFRYGRYAESIRAFTLGIDIAGKLMQEDGEAKRLIREQELSRLLFRRCAFPLFYVQIDAQKVHCRS